MPDPPEIDPLAADAIRTADHLRSALILAATELEILGLQLRHPAFQDRDGLLALANIAATGARQAREAAEPG